MLYCSGVVCTCYIETSLEIFMKVHVHAYNHSAAGESCNSCAEAA